MIRVMAGTVFLWEGILKFVYANQGVGRFTKLGFPAPHFTATADGWLEIIGILFRPISLSFRLFGNIYAGESILDVMSHMVPYLAWLLPIPFYFLEILVGFVQALVFMLLTAIFTLLIAQHGPGEEAH